MTHPTPEEMQDYLRESSEIITKVRTQLWELQQLLTMLAYAEHPNDIVLKAKSNTFRHDLLLTEESGDFVIITGLHSGVHYRSRYEKASQTYTIPVPVEPVEESVIRWVAQ
jgi:hypothetical protein